MPGFPAGLAAIGAGLGKFAQDYRQQQEAQQRQQLQALYVKQKQDEQAALAAQALTLGAGHISPVGGAAPGGMQQGGFPGSGAMPQAPQGPAAPPPAAAAPGPALPPTVQPPPIPGAPDVTPARQGMTVSGPLGPGGFGAIEAAIPAAPEALPPTVQPPPIPDAPQGVDAPSTPQAAGGGSAAPAPAADARPVLQAPGGQTLDLAQFMTRVDPETLFQRIKAAAPNATPQQQMMALNGLYKIYQSDNKTEQMLLAKVLGFNVGMARIATTERGQDLTHGDRAAGQDIQRGREQRIAGQADQRIALAQQRLAQTKGIGDRGQRQAALRTLLSDIDKMIQPGGLNSPPDAETLKGLQQQRQQVVNELRQMSGMPTPGAISPAGPAPSPAQ